jgi:PAS domain S-box-containing protein
MQTEEIRRRAAVLKTGALQNAILNSANFSSIATDEKGVIQIFNVGAERMLGYSAIDVLNRITPAEISDPQELVTRAKALSLELSTHILPGFEALVFKASRGIEDIYELTYIRKDGSRLPAMVSVTALRDEHEGIIGYLLIGTDNTARKLVEDERMRLDQRLRDQQYYTRSLIEFNIDALVTTDPQGIMIDVNRQMEALTGCTRDELIGAPFKDHFTDPERARAATQLVLIEKKVTNYELTARASDGRETLVSYNATTFYDRARVLQGVFAAARDITEERRTENALIASELRYRRLFETAKEGILILDPVTGRVVDVNPFLITLLGFSREQFLGKSIWELGFFKDIVANEEKFTELREKEYIRYENMPLETIDGQRIEVEFISNVYLVNGLKVIQCIIRDVSARRKAEEEVSRLYAELEQRVILRTVELESANRELEAFSYSVSHDLRAPLRAMDGFSQAVLEDFGGLLPDEGRRYLETIRAGAQRMGALIDALLSFARLSRQALNKRPVDTGRLVRSILDELGSPWPDRSVEIRLEELPESSGDPALLRQVWLNLLSNALKYTRRREKAVLEIGWLNLDGLRTFFVRDNGTGFDMRYVDKLFGVFQRFHRAEDFEGTGVGLAIVQRIVRRHGGRVWAEAEVDHGSTFYFTLEDKRIHE